MSLIQGCSKEYSRKAGRFAFAFALSALAFVGVAQAQTSPPQNISVVAGDGKIIFTWDAPTTGRMPTGYQVGTELCSETPTGAITGPVCTSSFNIRDVPAADANAGRFVRTGLRNGSAYVAAIRGEHSQGNSAWVGVAGVTPNPVRPPQNVSVVAGAGSLIFTWTAPTNDIVPTGYEVCYRLTSDPFTAGACIVMQTATESEVMAGRKVVSGLTVGSNYIAGIRGTHTNGDNSAWMGFAGLVPTPLPTATIARNTPATITEDETDPFHLSYIVTLDRPAPAGGLDVVVAIDDDAPPAGHTMQDLLNRYGIGPEDAEFMRTASFAEGETSKTVTWNFLPSNDRDNIINRDEFVVTASIVASDSIALGTPSSVDVTVRDDDISAIIVDTTRVNLEVGGGTAVVRYHLATEPTGNVGVGVAAANPAAATVSPAMLTFTTENYATPQAVTITYVSNTPTLINLSPGGGNYGPAVLRSAVHPERQPVVTVTTTTRTLSIANTSQTSFTEEDDAAVTFTATLSFAESSGGGDTVFAVAMTGADGFFAASERVKTFTIAEGDTTADVSFALAGDDMVDDAFATADATSLTATAVLRPRSVGTYAISATAGSAEVTIGEEENAGLVYSTDAIDLPLNSPRTFGVTLATVPIGSVAVGIQNLDAKVTFSGATRPFTADNWNTPQIYTVTANADATVDEEFDMDNFNLVVSGTGSPDYPNGVHAAGFTVTAAAALTPELSIVAGNPGATEATPFLLYVVHADPFPVTALTAQVTLSGAGNNVLATNMMQTALLSARATSVTIGFPLEDNDIAEAAVTATATIAASTDSSYTIASGRGSASSVIGDDDPPTPTNPRAIPGDQQATLTWEVPAGIGVLSGFNVCILRTTTTPVFSDANCNISPSLLADVRKYNFNNGTIGNINGITITNGVEYAVGVRSNSPTRVSDDWVTTRVTPNPLGLSDLAVYDSATGAAELTADYDADDRTYTVNLDHDVGTVYIQPTVSGGAATYGASSTALPSDSRTAITAPAAGASADTTITVTSSADSSVTVEYTLTLVRETNQPASAPSNVELQADDGAVIVLWSESTSAPLPNGHTVCVLATPATFNDTNCAVSFNGPGGRVATQIGSHRRTGLTNGTEYTAAVRAFRTRGVPSAWIQASSPVTPNSDDRTPSDVAFTALSAIEPNTPTTSSAVSVAGLGDGVSVIVRITRTEPAGVPATLSIDGGADVTSGSVSNGDTFSVTLTSAACGGGTPAPQTVSAFVQLGTSTDNRFDVTRRACATEGRLSALALSDVTLAPAFSMDMTTYTATVANSVSSTTVTATTLDDDASYAITHNDNAVSGDTVNLAVGANTIAITTTNEAGTGGSVYTITVTREPPPPNAPRSLRADALSTKIDVSWAAPGGPAPTHYDVCIVETTDSLDLDADCTATTTLASGTGNHREEVNDDATDTTHERTGLTNETAYTVAVRARNSVGESDWATTSATPMLPTISIRAERRAFYASRDDGAMFTLSLNQNIFGTAPNPSVTLSGPRELLLTYFAESQLTQAITFEADSRKESVTFDFNDDIDEMTEEIEVTATISMANANYKLDASTVTVTIGPNAPATAAVIEDSAAAITRAVTSIANAAVANRIAAVQTADPSAAGNFAQTATRILSAESRAMDAGESFGDGISSMMDGSIIALPYSHGDRRLDVPALWVSGDYRDISGGDDGADGDVTDDFDWDGEVVSIQLGVDARTARGWVVGGAVSSTTSDVEYKQGDNRGDQAMTLVSIHPYLGWRSRGGGERWATFGYGGGELESTPDGEDTETFDVDMASIAFGSATALNDNARGALRIKTEFSAARMTVENAGEDDRDIQADAHRARLQGEWNTTTVHADGARLRRALELGLRWDGGDGTTGSGGELGYQITYDNARGTTFSARARALLAHSEDYEEWGVSALLHHRPGADEQGLSLSLQPIWGISASSVDRLVQQGVTDLAPAPDEDAIDPAATLEGELGYGIAYRAGMMTPYSGFRLADGDRDWRIGARYKLRPIPVEMGLEAYRRDRADIENGVLLKARIRW